MADFVEFTAPVGIFNMEMVTAYTAVENDGVYGIKVDTGNGSPRTAIYPNTGVQADLVHVNAAFTAVDKGVAGNSITVAVVISGTDAEQSIVVTGTNIVFNSATDGSGVAISTEGVLGVALNADVDAAALISTIITGDGLTAVTALGATVLSDGADDTSEASRDALITAIDAAYKLVI